MLFSIFPKDMKHFYGCTLQTTVESLFSEYLLNTCNVPGIWDLMIKEVHIVSVPMAVTF